jgi:D-3-phosphoglycerate dehydrogenase / 2-oxoglutarate reductase
MTGAPADPSVFVYDPVDEPLDWLIERGVRVTLGAPVFSTGRSRPKISEDELAEAARGHTALMGASGTFITRQVLDRLPDLRFISKLGIGHEIIDLDAATARGIMVTNTPAHAEVGPVAEHAIALMLALIKQLHWYSASYIAGGGWRAGDRMAGTLRGSTVGIVGLGQIGQAVAARLQPWGACIVGTDIRAVTVPEGVEMVDLDTLLREADVVTLHAPGRPARQGPLLDEEHLRLLKPGALLVNTARGAVVELQPLLDALHDGRLGGAALDVLPVEPPAEPPEAPNLIVTPHAAWYSAGSQRRVYVGAVEAARSALRGERPASAVPETP